MHAVRRWALATCIGAGMLAAAAQLCGCSANDNGPGDVSLSGKDAAGGAQDSSQSADAGPWVGGGEGVDAGGETISTPAPSDAGVSSVGDSGATAPAEDAAPIPDAALDTSSNGGADATVGDGTIDLVEAAGSDSNSESASSSSGGGASGDDGSSGADGSSSGGQTDSADDAGDDSTLGADSEDAASEAESEVGTVGYPLPEPPESGGGDDATTVSDGSQDAIADVVDAAASTISILLAGQGQDCVNCALATDAGTSCLALYSCEALAAGVTEAGVSRQQLCQDTLTCELRTNCQSVSTIGCYCGTAATVDCEHDAGAATGPCADQERAGLESTDPIQVSVVRYHKTIYGAGVANQLVQCLLSHHCNCFSPK